MQAVFKQTEGDYLEAVIEVAGQPLTVMDEFGGDSLTYGEIIDIELSVGIACEQEDQNTMSAYVGWRHLSIAILAAKASPSPFYGSMPGLYHNKLRLIP